MKALAVLGVLFAMWFSAVWQQSAAGTLGVFGLKPDFMFIVIVLVAIRSRPSVAAVTGFFGGLLQGGPAGANLTAYCLTRMVVAFACAFIARTGLSLNPLSVAGLTVASTAVAQLVLLFLAPPPDIGVFLGATLGTAIYNGVVAGLIDALLRRTLEKQVD